MVVRLDLLTKLYLYRVFRSKNDQVYKKLVSLFNCIQLKTEELEERGVQMNEII